MGVESLFYSNLYGFIFTQMCSKDGYFMCNFETFHFSGLEGLQITHEWIMFNTSTSLWHSRLHTWYNQHTWRYDLHTLRAVFGNNNFSQHPISLTYYIKFKQLLMSKTLYLNIIYLLWRKNPTKISVLSIYYNNRQKKGSTLKNISYVVIIPHMHINVCLRGQ